MNFRSNELLRDNWALLILVTIISFFTYFYNYQNPQKLFWDENYHVVAAQKYLNNVFFMEPHPPLGKLLIALGEYLLDTNRFDSQYLDDEVIKGDLPEGFSFTGYRLFPALFAWLTAPLIFLLMYSLFPSRPWAVFIAFCYSLENAVIVHSRGAMLEGSQLFFIVATLLVLSLVYRRLEKEVALGWLPILLGVMLGCAVTIKVTSLILAIGFFPICFKLIKQPKKLFKFLLQVLVSFCLLAYAVWQIHFMIGTTVRSQLQGQGLYAASEPFREIVKNKEQWNPLNFPLMLKDSFRYFTNYEKGVARLNLCKEGENGSYPGFWPLGARSIRYRWDKETDFVRYKTLQVNPFTWFAGLSGVIAAFILLAHTFFFSERKFDAKFIWIFTYFGMWLSYMIVMLSVSRAMYLYHYFIPFIFSLVLLGLIIPFFKLPKKLVSDAVGENESSFLLCVCALLVFLIYAPLTYGWPLKDSQVASRALLSLWDLGCLDCGLTNKIALPLKGVEKDPFRNLSINGIAATTGYQEWGAPLLNRSVEGSEIVVAGKKYLSGFGVHARSLLGFVINKKFVELTGAVAIPDYLKLKENAHPSVVFEVWLDSVLIWRSGLITIENPYQEFRLPVVQGSRLELKVEDGGDGKDNDHAVWLNLELH